jgi:phage baseplate assembly protein W
MTENLPVRPGEPDRYDSSFIGRGFSWPLTVDHTGSIKLTNTIEDIERTMRIILMTAPGERVMRPRFGCSIWDLLFEPVTENLLGLIAESVYEALGQWEPRVEVDEVIPVADQDDHALVQVHVRYRLRSTNDPRNLVFPFYVIPHEEEGAE